jgi:hypothetical protein
VGRDPTLQGAGIVLFYPLVAAAAWGAVVLLRRGRALALAVVLAPVVVSSITAATTYGLPRLRHVVDLSLIAVAGAGFATFVLVRPARGMPSRSRIGDRT